MVNGPSWTLEALATPGHTVNHMAFALRERELLFSGDHVMAWSTSIVAPPDGAMREGDVYYKLLGRSGQYNAEVVRQEMGEPFASAKISTDEAPSPAFDFAEL